jgi:hypothetical protein
MIGRICIIFARGNNGRIVFSYLSRLREVGSRMSGEHCDNPDEQWGRLGARV